MDGTQFDHFTRALAITAPNRRGLLRIGTGGFAAMMFNRAATDVAACRGNGVPCDKERPNGGCCSGTCKKGRCRRTSGAAGCTVRMDVCKNDELFRCPNNPEGLCVKLDNGKPYCAARVVCYACASNADCASLTGLPGRCITTCTTCNSNSNGRACLFDQQIM